MHLCFFLLFALVLEVYANPYPRHQTLGTRLGTGELFVGITEQNDPLSVYSEFFSLDSQGVRHPLASPEVLRDREIVGIFPGSPETVLVVSQWVIESGDQPLVHEFHSKTREWTERGRIPCIAHRNLRSSPNGLRYECVEDEIQNGQYVERILKKEWRLR